MIDRSPVRRRWWLLAVVLVFSLIAPAATGPVLAQPTNNAALVREGYERMLALYVDPLEPADILGDAWDGAVGAAIAAGVDRLPQLEPLPEDRRGAWSAFETAFRDLETESTGLIGGRLLAYAALDAMAEARNECHTHFMTPEEYRHLRDEIDGRVTISGIGIASTLQQPFTIVRVYPDSPAERAGLAAGDIILAVDGMPAAEQTNTSLTALIRGPEGTTVMMTVQRPGEEEPRTFSMTRTRIQPPILTSTLRPDGIAVITLSTFATDGSSERLLRDALESMEAQGARAWVLDLRANGGGSLFSFLSVLGVFLSEDIPAITLENRLTRVRLSPSGPQAVVQRPLAVLVDQATGSGAEITASVLQDTGRARVFGQRTAGCANLATLSQMSDGSGMIVVSERLLAGPHERAVDGAGVTPDELTPMGAAPDPTLQAAVTFLASRLPAVAAR